MIDALPLLLGDDGYQISRSVRLRSSASAYFNRTPASAGNRRTWTWSGWVKRGDLGPSSVPLLSAYNNASNFDLLRFSSNSLQFYTIAGGVDYSEETPAVFRDPSAWYHVVLSVDTTNATAANRFRLYVNGVQQTTTQTFGQVPQNYDCYVNSTNAHNIGRNLDNTAQVFDGYLTEINFIDGQALTPSAFGETDAITGVWKPKKYTGTYGTNGFYLNFSDPSAATATTIGKDYSGNGNNWTPNNISVTAGATYDSMLDVPTPWADGGNGRGNYAVLNPLFRGVNTPGTMQAANLELSAPNNTFWYNGVGTTFVSTGKWYAEFTPLSGTTSSVMVGVANDAYRANDFPGGTGSNGYSYVSNSGNKFFNNTGAGTAYGASFTTGDVIGVALDLDAGSLTFYKNGVSQGTAFTGIAAGNWTFAAASAAASVIAVNFGQRPFAYTPPSGFKALHTGNLPEPTIKKGNAYFDATTYTGNGSTQSIVNSGSMQPDLVWVKRRDSAVGHILVDAVRGANQVLRSNETTAEGGTGTYGNTITGFNSNGFALGNDAVIAGGVNASGNSYVGWQWKEGATQGFDIVTYTGNSTNRTIAHGLGVAPAMIIIKNRSQVATWIVGHQNMAASSPWNGFMQLNQTAAYTTSGGSLIWNNTAPTSSVFSVGTDTSTNFNGNNFVAYLWAAVPGFSAFGSYTGNGSTDGVFVHLGFRARWILVKAASGGTASSNNWFIMDTARDPSNVQQNYLMPSSSSAEAITTFWDVNANGIKIRAGIGGINENGTTYIYAAFAENAFRYSLAR